MPNTETSRRAQRIMAFQALYSLEFQKCPDEESLKNSFHAMYSLQADNESEINSSFAWDLFYGIWTSKKYLDEVITLFAKNWRIERLGRVELNLLRLGVYELLYREDIPAKVSLAEIIDMSKKFADRQSVAFINGILDTVFKAKDSGQLPQSEN